MNLSDALAGMPVSELDLGRFVALDPGQTIAQAVEAMNEAGRSAACVVSDGHLHGIFTQRDVLLRAIGRPLVWDHLITDEMTRAVHTMGIEQSAAEGLAIMNEWWVRTVPVLDSDGLLTGCLSYYTMMDTIAALVSKHMDDPDLEPDVRHGLTLIDFTGLHTNPPVTVAATDTVDTAAHHMKARAIGSVLVVDDHQRLVGVLTEFDLQTKVGCREPDLSKIGVAEVMTEEPVALAVRSPIAGAIAQMADRGFSHIPLLGESGRPVAVASFRDIASYLETSFAALG